MKRRHLIRSLAALPALAIPAVASAHRFPIVKGDGIHDDAPGLNALLRGEIVDFRADWLNALIETGRWPQSDIDLEIIGAKFHLVTPLETPENVAKVQFSGCSFTGPGTSPFPLQRTFGANGKSFKVFADCTWITGFGIGFWT